MEEIIMLSNKHAYMQEIPYTTAKGEEKTGRIEYFIEPETKEIYFTTMTGLISTSLNAFFNDLYKGSEEVGKLEKRDIFCTLEECQQKASYTDEEQESTLAYVVSLSSLMVLIKTNSLDNFFLKGLCLILANMAKDAHTELLVEREELEQECTN